VKINGMREKHVLRDAARDVLSALHQRMISLLASFYLAGA
jgi:hypothetical protein